MQSNLAWIGPASEISPGASDHPNPYELKFVEFLYLLRTTKEELIIVHHPEVLGDSYGELVESLNRLADSGKKLVIVPRGERG